MRCPSCHDEYEPHVRACAACGVPLVPVDVEVPTARPLPGGVDARLGTFHPVAAAAVAELLRRRGIPHEERTLDADRVEVLVERGWRDDVRAELALTWGELVRSLPEEQVLQVLAAGGPNPGWHDPPRGGHVDRQGRLVVGDDEVDAEEDAARVVGPALLTVGAILAVVGWYVLGSPAVTLAGAAMAVAGLFTPR
jgi:hypothetical protein